MAVSKSEFDKLKHRVDLLEAPAKLVLDGNSMSGRLRWTPTKTIVAVGSVILTVIISAVSATHVIDSEIAGRFGDLSARETKVEAAVKVLASKQSGRTQELIKDLLSAARISDDPHAAEIEIEIARSLVNKLREGKVDSPPGFFESVSNELEPLSKFPGNTITSSVFRTQRLLAEYRSSLETPPTIPSNTNSIEMLHVSPPFHGPSKVQKGIYRITRGLRIHPGVELLGYGAAIDGSSIPANTDMLVPLTNQLSRNRNTVEGLTLIGASQTLDGISWNHVTFLNERIKYRGGSTHLEGVRFVNCTFDLSRNRTSSQILNYAALKKNLLTVRPSAG